MNISKEITQEEVGRLFDNYDPSEQLIINTYGGDLNAGWAMYDFLTSKDLGSVKVIGVCMSSGTIPLLAFDERIGSANSKFLIHNPWAIVVGGAKEFKKLSDELTVEEKRLVDLYKTKLNLTSDEIINLMNEEKELTAEEALHINLITKIDNEMSRETDLDQKLEEMENSIIGKLKNFFTKSKIQNLVIQTQGGEELDFGPDVETEEQIIIGVTATADGSPADGDYTRPNGDVLTFVAGELTAITKPEQEESGGEGETEAEMVERISALQNELKEAKSYSEKLEGKFNSVLESSKTMSKNITELQEKISKLSTNHNPGYNTPSKKEKKEARVGNKRK
ncbi:MAG: ATP-dependent Clp protease proteolytic subunit [Salinivirgaceae bacterium]